MLRLISTGFGGKILPMISAALHQPKILSVGKFLRLLLIALMCCSFAGCSMFGSSGGSGTSAKVFQTAKTQIGRKYVFGGTSPKQGFDCSGLVFWAYGQHGITVPRNTSQQAKFGKGVSLKDARQGDVIVFKIGRGLHTGLIAGNGQFLHAPSTGKTVRMESYNNSYWRPKIIGVRRFV